MQRTRSPYTARSSSKVIRHAVSIDERRAKFRQDLMYQTSHQKEHGRVRKLLHDAHARYRGPAYRKPSTATESVAKNGKEQVEDRGRPQTLAVPGQEAEYVRYKAPPRSRSGATRTTATSGPRSAAECAECASISSQQPSQVDDESDDDDGDQDMDEVWFAGGHGDFGGGWEIIPGTKSASHIPLAWMVREAMRAGLSFDTERVVAMGCADAFAPGGGWTSQQSRRATQSRDPPVVPDIRIDDNAQMGTTSLAVEEADFGDVLPVDMEHTSQPTHFKDMLYKAHVARIHDSLTLDCGMSKVSVLSWRMMEYLPFRRMDLQPNGSWKPIRWPLPRGEVRDIPNTARVHGSVIRRLQQCEDYRPGNLIVGGGGRGSRTAPKEYGIGQWECIAEEVDPIGEIWVKKID